MNGCWLVTPYFFDERDLALREAVPPGIPYQENYPGAVTDRSAASLARTHVPIAEFVEKTVLQNDLPICVAGDCGASLPVMAGLQKAGLDPVLVWLDAHGDFNTPDTSPSGFIGGMPLAMMVGRGDLAIPGMSGQTPIREENVWLIDARDLDPPEEKALASSRVNHAGLEALNSLVLDRPVHLHIDNDIIDRAEVPANNYPVSNGPSLAATIQACVSFASQNQLCAVSLSGWNGELDRDGRTGRACAKLLASILDAGAEGI